MTTCGITDRPGGLAFLEGGRRAHTAGPESTRPPLGPSPGPCSNPIKDATTSPGPTPAGAAAARDAVAQGPGQARDFCLEETDSPDGRRRHALINHRTATPHLPEPAHDLLTEAVAHEVPPGGCAVLREP